MKTDRGVTSPWRVKTLGKGGSIVEKGGGPSFGSARGKKKKEDSTAMGENYQSHRHPIGPPGCGQREYLYSKSKEEAKEDFFSKWQKKDGRKKKKISHHS